MPKSDSPPRKPCCMISEILEEAGLDRAKARQLRRQILQGAILFCQWQLERMEGPDGRKRRPASRKRARKVKVG